MKKVVNSRKRGFYVKRYLLFLYNEADPQGGWHDFEGAYEKKCDAEHVAELHTNKNRSMCWHIYDTKCCQVIACKDTYM